MSAIGFFSRNDSGSILEMEYLFNNNGKYIYFIENAVTHEWLTKAHEWTKDPQMALSFKSSMKARVYAVESGISGWIITEHEVVK